MNDLTQGSIPRHLVRLAAPMAAGMVFQTLYYLVDLWFVARLGGTALAGVSAAGTLQFIVLGLTQVLGIGTMVLISHAAGRKDRADANLIFNQSLLLAALCAAATLAAGYGLSGWYLRTVAADAATAAAGRAYLNGFIPALALQFALVSMGSALRGTGIAKPTMVVQMLSVLVNAALAPVLIAGWGTGRPLGVAGAGLASTIAVALSVVALLVYFVRLEKYVGYERALFRPRPEAWRRILRIGIPAGGEFGLMFVFMGVVYWVTSGFGPDAQAGFGVGSRVMQAIFLPAMAIAFAAAPIAGQNHAARRPERVRETLRTALVMGSGLMATLTLLCHWRPDLLVAPFASDAEVVHVAAEYLGITSWNFVASGVIFTCSGFFQAFGNTWPSLVSSGTRLVTFAAPAIWLSARPGFQIRHLWHLSVATVSLQMLFSLWLLRRETSVFRTPTAS